MIRRIAPAAALVATAVDLAGAPAVQRTGDSRIIVPRATIAIALAACALAFAMVAADQWRRRGLWRHGSSFRLPIAVRRACPGAAVLGRIAGSDPTSFSRAWC